ncbi:MAG: N-formylglutamate amidohydrolase [Alphaproteobacteria bacterium]
MSTFAAIDTGTESRTLLRADDPAPVTVLNATARARAVIVCDHGGDAVPRALNGLGLDPSIRARHIAWDIGAADVARRLAARMALPAVLARYSRLVIDLNRPLDDLTSIREISDGVVIPGNRRLTDDETEARAAEIFRPYHAAVAAALDACATPVPAVISVHSFTPVMKGFERPWHIGVLYNADARIARPLMSRLAAVPEVTVGDNLPYSGYDLFGNTIETHAMPQGRPNILLEIRQDLIDTRHGAEKWAGIVADALAPVLADADLYRVFGNQEA